MKRNRKETRILLLLILLLGITLGYAALATTLKIVGDATVKKQTWDVYWANPQVTQGSVSSVLPTIGVGEDNLPNTKVSFEVNFNEPGQFYEFTIDAVNNGTIDAMITGIENKVNNTDIDSDPSPLPPYINYSVTYDDGTTIQENDTLLKKTTTATTKKYKIRVEWLTNVDSSSLGDDELTLNFKYGVTYGQYTPTSEPEETWDTYYYTIWDEENNTYTYDQGTTTTFSNDWAFWARENSTKKQVCGKLANGPVCVEAPTDAEDMANIKNIMEENGASCMDSTNGYWCSFNSETLDNLYIHIEMYDDVKEVTFDDAQYTDGSHYCGVRADGTIGCD